MCFYMVRVGGFEPTTNRLKVYCSTNWAILALIWRRNALLLLRCSPALLNKANATKRLRCLTIILRLIFISYNTIITSFSIRVKCSGIWQRVQESNLWSRNQNPMLYHLTNPQHIGPATRNRTWIDSLEGYCSVHWTTASKLEALLFGFEPCSSIVYLRFPQCWQECMNIYGAG